MNNSRLKGKVALITGASRGIGRSTAELFFNEGASLILSANKNIKLLKEIESNFAHKEKKVLIVEADLSNKEGIDYLLKQTFKKFPKLDILVNNAGIFEQADFENINEAQFDAMIAVNTKSVFFLCQEVIKCFKKQKQGKIINVSSLSGKIGSSRAPHYAISKAGVIALTKSLARVYGKFNINVNAISPSLVQTDMIKKISQERLNCLIDAIPLKRLGLPEEVAYAILFFASSASDYINGQILGVDGGISMI